MNYTSWNCSFWTWLFGYFCSIIFSVLFSLVISILFARKTKKIFISVVLFVSIILISIPISYFSFRISYWQVENKLKSTKAAIDKYFINHKKYPMEFSDLKKEGYIKNLDRPIFLIPNGKYHLRLESDTVFYGLSLEASELGVCILKDNSFNPYDN
ncbi:MAG TPA: hypothetical protein PKI86_11725 [Chitinophagales bacterium]|nr:hypothetical protein [Chitinophagales bacterium]